MSRKIEADVVVVGAGPVGLLAAVALKRAGVDVRVFDSNRRTGVHSYASVLHAESLRTFERLGVLRDVMQRGVVVGKVGLYEGPARGGEIDIAKVPGEPRHLVVLPQSRLESILEDALAAMGTSVDWLHRVQDIDAGADGVHLTIAKLDSVSTGYPIARSEQVVSKVFDISARYLIGADGYDSFVRRRLGIDFTDLGGQELVSVYQCEVDGAPPQEGRLMFGASGLGAYWPLPNGRCRLSFPVPSEAEHQPDAAGLAARLREQAPWFTNEVKSLEWTASARFERRLASRFGENRVWLAGDAAHLTSPAGAQSMNVGLLEAVDLAQRLASAVDGGTSAASFDEYSAQRGAEWRRLLGIDAKLQARSQGFAARHAARLLPSIPASGADLTALLASLDLELVPV